MTLEIYIGPMYAGKTTKLINMYYANKETNKVIIDYNTDNDNNMVYIDSLLNHTTQKIDGVYKTKSLKNLYNISNDTSYHSAKYIYINECQFFPDLFDYVTLKLKEQKHIYIYGLDGDFKQDIFGETFSLIPYSSKVEKIQGKCQYCENSSVISHRVTNQKDVYLPDSSLYIPLCLECVNR